MCAHEPSECWGECPADVPQVMAEWATCQHLCHLDTICYVQWLVILAQHTAHHAVMQLHQAVVVIVIVDAMCESSLASVPNMCLT